MSRATINIRLNYQTNRCLTFDENIGFDGLGTTLLDNFRSLVKSVQLDAFLTDILNTPAVDPGKILYVEFKNDDGNDDVYSLDTTLNLCQGVNIIEYIHSLPLLPNRPLSMKEIHGLGVPEKASDYEYTILPNSGLICFNNIVGTPIDDSVVETLIQFNVWGHSLSRRWMVTTNNIAVNQRISVL